MEGLGVVIKGVGTGTGATERVGVVAMVVLGSFCFGVTVLVVVFLVVVLLEDVGVALFVVEGVVLVLCVVFVVVDGDDRVLNDFAELVRDPLVVVVVVGVFFVLGEVFLICVVAS